MAKSTEAKFLVALVESVRLKIAALGDDRLDEAFELSRKTMARVRLGAPDLDDEDLGEVARAVETLKKYFLALRDRARLSKKD